MIELGICSSITASLVSDCEVLLDASMDWDVGFGVLFFCLVVRFILLARLLYFVFVFFRKLSVIFSMQDENKEISIEFFDNYAFDRLADADQMSTVPINQASFLACCVFAEAPSETLPHGAHAYVA